MLFVLYPTLNTKNIFYVLVRMLQRVGERRKGKEEIPDEERITSNVHWVMKEEELFFFLLFEVGKKRDKEEVIGDV